jgi:hypothetical protein
MTRKHDRKLRQKVDVLVAPHDKHEMDRDAIATVSCNPSHCQVSGAISVDEWRWCEPYLYSAATLSKI